jgi:hypothetical protein
MSLAVAERTDLLDPGRRLAQYILHDAGCCRIQGLTARRCFPWQRPSLPISGAAREQDRQLVSHCRHEDDIDGMG